MSSKILQPRVQQSDHIKEAYKHACTLYVADNPHASLLHIQQRTRQQRRFRGWRTAQKAKTILISGYASISNTTVSLHLDKYHRVSVVYIITSHHCWPDSRASKKKQSKAYDVKSTLPRVLLSTTKKGQQLCDLLGMIDFSLRGCNE